ncbi:MAG: hypothetical protein U0X87_07700 [Anaerolineales bacterium]
MAGASESRRAIYFHSHAPSWCVGRFCPTAEVDTSLLVPVILFALIYYPYLFLQTSKKTHRGLNTLTVMTYNVLFSNNDYDAAADADPHIQA